MDDVEIISNPTPALLIRIFRNHSLIGSKYSIEGYFEYQEHLKKITHQIEKLQSVTDILSISHKSKAIDQLVDKILTIPVFFQKTMDFSFYKVEDTWKPTTAALRGASQAAAKAYHDYLNEHENEPTENINPDALSLFQ